ncbi:MAG: family 16 glycosylhydrolase [Polyangiaceae bacterium]
MNLRPSTTWASVVSAAFIATLLLPRAARATTSAELYTSAAEGYGRFEARLRFASGDGVVSSFFLWKDGSEQAGTFWNELDFEKLGADCHLQTNALYGNPVGDHSKQAALTADLCNAYHVYAYEWLPDSIAWFVDGTEIRRETGAVALAYANNAPNGMQVHFNIWPGNASFGGNFSPSILPVHEYIDWFQFSPYANGAFAAAKWREDFSDPALPSTLLTGTWASPKNLSTDDPINVNFIDGYAVLSLTADNATGPAGAMPSGGVSAGGNGGNTATNTGGASGTATSSAGAPTNTGGSSSPSGATTTGMNGATAPGAPPSLGCGCMQARSRGSLPPEFPVGTLVLATLVGAFGRRRRVGLKQ